MCAVLYCPGYTVTVSNEPSPTNTIYDSQNHITIYTQPPYSVAACLATGMLCLFTQRLNMATNTTATATKIKLQWSWKAVLIKHLQLAADILLVLSNH